MKIILVISDTQRRNLVFVTDTLKVYSLPEIIKTVKNRDIQSVHIVKTGAGSYLRTNPNTTSKDNLDFYAHSSYQLNNAIDNAAFVSGPGLRQYWHAYSESLEKMRLKKDEFIWIEGKKRTTKEHVITILKKYRRIIHNAASHFDIKPYLLGAIMIDEIARMAPFEEIINATALFTLNWNASVGVAQVKLDTAKHVIQAGYYNPNPKDPRLSKKKAGKISRQHLYQYVSQPKHSIFFSAARIRQIIDYWSDDIDLSNRADIIGTLYSQGLGEPKEYPQSIPRGDQIQNEFYPLAKITLFNP